MPLPLARRLRATALASSCSQIRQEPTVTDRTGALLHPSGGSRRRHPRHRGLVFVSGGVAIRVSGDRSRVTGSPGLGFVAVVSSNSRISPESCAWQRWSDRGDLDHHRRVAPRVRRRCRAMACGCALHDPCTRSGRDLRRAAFVVSSIVPNVTHLSENN